MMVVSQFKTATEKAVVLAQATYTEGSRLHSGVCVRTKSLVSGSIT